MLKRIVPLFLIFVCFAACSKKQKPDSKNENSEVEKMNADLYLLVGTYTSSESKGIYVYGFDSQTGRSEYISEAEVENPSYLEVGNNGKYVYAVSENKDIKTAVISAFGFDKTNGALGFINKQQTGGGSPCYVCIDESGKHIVTANYSGASISEFTTNEDGSLNPANRVITFDGKGVDPKRQKQPHLHCVSLSPDQKYLFANDLGTDKIHKFETNAEGAVYLKIGTPSSYKLPDGAGPRHMAFHPNGKYLYVIAELSGEVVCFDYDKGNLTQIQRIQADTLSAKGSADIHISGDGKFLYASNRLQGDGIAVFSINEQDGKLTKAGYQPTEIHPRNFIITPNDKYLLVANRDSDKIQVFQRNEATGLLTDTGNDILLSRPVCLKFTSFE